MSDVGFIAIIVSVLILAVSILFLTAELRSTKRTQQTSIALQLAQQLQDPALQKAMQSLRSRVQRQASPNASSNGHLIYHDEPQQTRDVDVATVIHYFGQVGDLVRREIVGPEIIRLLGPVISEQWHFVRAITVNNQQDINQEDLEHFAYLYTEWLNYDYAQRVPVAVGTQQR